MPEIVTMIGRVPIKKNVTFPHEGSPNEFPGFIYNITMRFSLEFKPFGIPNLRECVVIKHKEE
jgi:hypothetical protein